MTQNHSRVLADSESARLIDFGSIGHEEIGYLTAVEVFKGVPFEVKRAYWTYGTPSGMLRGHHAHRELEQVIVAVAGKLEIDIEGPARAKATYIMDSPKHGLYVPKMHWRTIRFGEGAVLLSLASMLYDENEYIRDYSEFERLCAK